MRKWKEREGRWQLWVFIAIMCLTFPNLLVMHGISAWLGGDAWHGKIEAGRYFVDSKGHLTEVSRFAYHVSLYQTYSVFFGYAALFAPYAIYQIVRMIDRVKAVMRSSAP